MTMMMMIQMKKNWLALTLPQVEAAFLLLALPQVVVPPQVAARLPPMGLMLYPMYEIDRYHSHPIYVP